MYHVDDGLASSLNESWIKIVFEMLSRFGIWHHANGVVLAWFATLDVLLLGYVKTPAAWIGLYATRFLKLSNFIPIAGTALASLMMMWLGRRQATGRGREVKVLALGAGYGDVIGGCGSDFLPVRCPDPPASRRPVECRGPIANDDLAHPMLECGGSFFGFADARDLGFTSGQTLKNSFFGFT